MAGVFTVGMLIMSVVAGIGFWVYYQKLNGNGVSINIGNVELAGTAKDEKNIHQRDMNKSKLQDFFEIDDIDDYIIKLTKNNGMRVILSISSPDFALLNEDEKTIFENALLDLGLALNFPIQFFTTTTKVETKKAAEKVNAVINSDDDAVDNKLREYSRLLHDRLINLESARNVYVRKSYCVIGVDGINDKKRALSELRNRVETVNGSLLMAKMRVSVLQKEKAAQLFANVLNKGSNISIEGLLEKDVLSTYSVGVERK